ncbi:MAG TPA: tRNA (adenosine(37)-N6)-dimethylallyltransferase MiaA [Bacteroidia bacterium]|nr:tRNA (adenosine(37)-N6)-dimethylallyltransferase MiaA [Bacteroidia bacterium]
MKDFNCIVVLGPTASGKTHLACQLAYYLNGEVISADSRQVYQYLDIGTGKDLNEYCVKGQKINHHLIGIVHPREQFYLHQFIEESRRCFEQIVAAGKIPVFCGGTGLYLDALRKDFSLTAIKEDPALRQSLENLSKEALIKRLSAYTTSHTQHVDLNSKKRIIRGIEIAEYFASHQHIPDKITLPYRPFYIGIKTDLETRKQRISERLSQRLETGLIEEVQNLLDSGISAERLALFGLEYKHVLFFLQNKITKQQLFSGLQTAIFQFAKRQMTWFRKMEKEGVEIHWVEKDADPKTLIQILKYCFHIGGTKNSSTTEFEV